MKCSVAAIMVVLVRVGEKEKEEEEECPEETTAHFKTTMKALQA